MFTLDEHIYNLESKLGAFECDLVGDLDHCVDLDITFKLTDEDFFRFIESDEPDDIYRYNLLI